MVYGLRLRVGPWVVPVLAAVSLLVDVDHLPPHFGFVHRLVLHNVFFLLFAGAAVGLLLGRGVGLVFAYMLLGHLLFDMVGGMYGVPLMWPLSRADFILPESWEVWLFGDPSYTVVSRMGLAMAAYFGIALFSIFCLRRRASC
ncbi:MAG: hypothetical protein V1875_06865 [Candidatus Altiarchaeota archaeon]